VSHCDRIVRKRLAGDPDHQTKLILDGASALIHVTRLALMRTHQVLLRFFFYSCSVFMGKCDGTAIVASYNGLLTDLVMYWMRIAYTGPVLPLDRPEKCEIWEFAQQSLVNESGGI
jgi:hypothetical protein